MKSQNKTLIKYPLNTQKGIFLKSRKTGPTCNKVVTWSKLVHKD